MSFYTKITVQGVEAEKFLQGQLTCDLRKANTETPLLGAHCNPKGRIISLFFLLKIENGFSLLIPEDLGEIAYHNLKKYAQFFKQVSLGKPEATDWLPPTLVMPAQAGIQKIRLAHIEAGHPLIYAATSELFLPHDINLPQLGGVSFTKGCYTGQEIIARMENLGKPKQHLYSIVIASETKQSSFKNDEETLQPGTKIYLPEKPESEVGYIVDAAKKENSTFALASLKDWAAEPQMTVVGKISHIEPI